MDPSPYSSSFSAPCLSSSYTSCHCFFEIGSCIDRISIHGGERGNNIDLFLRLILNNDDDEDHPGKSCTFHYDTKGNVCLLDVPDNPSITSVDWFVDYCVENRFDAYELSADIAKFVRSEILRYIRSVMDGVREGRGDSDRLVLNVDAIMNIRDEEGDFMDVEEEIVGGA